jgi:hypothetical protein
MRKPVGNLSRISQPLYDMRTTIDPDYHCKQVRQAHHNSRLPLNWSLNDNHFGRDRLGYTYIYRPKGVLENNFIQHSNHQHNVM